MADSFQEDQCLMRAAALTYATSLAIVPLLAVAFSILKGFGFQNTVYIREFLLKLSAGKEPIVQTIIDYINRTQVGALGAIGVGVLLITVFSLLGSIEQSLNTVWGVRHQRGLSRKFADYFSVTLVSPLLIVVAYSFSASLESLSLVQGIISLPVINQAYILFLQIMPYAMVCFALFFLYKFVPNTRTDLSSCLIGGVAAGLLWQVLQKVFISYQIGVSRYNAIYGSFAQLPLFLIWLYLSWIVVLLGAEICFALEQRKHGLTHSSLGRFNIESTERLAMAVMALVSRDFAFGREPASPTGLAGELEIPLKPVNQILGALVEMGMVLEVGGKKNQAYVPAVSPDSMSCGQFRQLFRRYAEESAFRFTGGPEAVDRFFRELEEGDTAGDNKWSLKDMADAMGRNL